MDSGRRSDRIHSARIALRILRREIGTFSMFSLLMDLGKRSAQGEPFRGYRKSSGEKEDHAREQAGEAIVLYKILRERLGAEKALPIMQELIAEGAVVFLSRVLGQIKKDELYALSEEAQLAYLESRIDRFPNSDAEIASFDNEHFTMKITRCLFAEYCRDLDVPELAATFCAGDGRFFESPDQEANFVRPETIAGGDVCCTFQFRWKQ